MRTLEARDQAAGDDGRTLSDSTRTALAAVSSGMVVSLFADHLMRSISSNSLAQPQPATLTETAFAIVLPHAENCA
jgi:hypothetical protein